jgi:hypothetical protein
MSNVGTTATKTPTPTGLPVTTLNRVLDEGYGPGAWYGADLRAAIDGVTPAVAFARPAASHHNVAEIALHHAYWAGQIQAKLTGEAAPPFPLEGEDWFELNDESRLSWSAVRAAVAAAQAALSRAVAEIGEGKRRSPLAEAERFDITLGITGHAAYHAGQIQLVKKLVAA